MFEIGGHPMVLRANELQLTRGESIRDTALVFSRHAAVIGLRTSSEERLRELAEHAEVPVVNMLSPDHHPLPGARRPDDAARGVRRRSRAACSPTWGTATTSRARSRSSARWPAWRCAWRRRAGFQLAEPHGARAHRRPGRGGRRRGRRLHRRLGLDGRRRATQAAARREALAPYRLDDALLDRAAPAAIALHCLPAHPGEEITEEVLYGDRASASGTRPRTAATRRRRCSSCSLE